MDKDTYFIKKTEEILNKLNDIDGFSGEVVFDPKDPTCKMIYLALKEVAKDQRYTCIESLNGYTGMRYYDEMISRIQNSSIKESK